jgi:hypothetical protein
MCPPFRWDYARFGKPGVTPGTPDETIEIAIVKHNAAAHGFNRWTLNGDAFSPETMKPMSSSCGQAALRLYVRPLRSWFHIVSGPQRRASSGCR